MVTSPAARGEGSESWGWDEPSGQGACSRCQLSSSWGCKRSRALPGARARWHRGLEVEGHRHGKAVEELFVPLILFGFWWFAGSLPAAGCSEVARTEERFSSWDYAKDHFLARLLFPLHIPTKLQYIAFKKHECLLLLVTWLTLEGQPTWLDVCRTLFLHCTSRQTCMSHQLCHTRVAPSPLTAGVTWHNCGVPTPSWGLQTLYSSQLMHSRKECGFSQLEIAGMVFEGKGIWGQTECISYKNDWVAINFITAYFSMCFLSSAWKEAVDCGCLCLSSLGSGFCNYAGPENL